jgi:hypothetical protein
MRKKEDKRVIINETRNFIEAYSNLPDCVGDSFVACYKVVVGTVPVVAADGSYSRVHASLDRQADHTHGWLGSVVADMDLLVDGMAVGMVFEEH